MYYEYECKLCGHRAEVPFPMGAQPARCRCEHCGGVMPRVFSPLQFIFTGRRHDTQMDNLDRDLYYASKESPQAR
jgi:putative FmdB family regulatory protein